MRFQRNPGLDRLIALRDSDRPEDRALFNSRTNTTLRLTLGYYEADLAKQPSE
ncbi:hypothetical protein AB0N73_04075 [Microbacterium sp. NPDC089189]|uniref:hypothetical protein n=1 Tax=Microbacterium sp. NPDC089189 TaxID=3154972 RepID=UPI00341C465E